MQSQTNMNMMMMIESKHKPKKIYYYAFSLVQWYLSVDEEDEDAARMLYGKFGRYVSMIHVSNFVTSFQNACCYNMWAT